MHESLISGIVISEIVISEIVISGIVISEIVMGYSPSPDVPALWSIPSGKAIQFAEVKD
jgi:hypothetical protein